MVDHLRDELISVIAAGRVRPVRDAIANLITTHRGHMDDPNWLTHIELADLILQALDIEGWSVVRADALERVTSSERQAMIALLRAEHALRTVQEFFRDRPAPDGWPVDLINGAQGQAKSTLDAHV